MFRYYYRFWGYKNHYDPCSRCLHPEKETKNNQKKKKKKPLILEMLKESVHRANENTEADVINHTQEGQG